jgi:hypothetical protein
MINVLKKEDPGLKPLKSCKIRNLQQNIPFKRKCSLLVIFFQKNISTHDSPKNMHPRYSPRAALFARYNLCPKAWGCIIYKWVRGKLFYSTGRIVKCFI